MGFVYADIELINPRDESLKSLFVHALVDTGVMTLCTDTNTHFCFVAERL